MFARLRKLQFFEAVESCTGGSGVKGLIKLDDYFCVLYLVSGIKRCSPNKIKPDSIRLRSIFFDCTQFCLIGLICSLIEPKQDQMFDYVSLPNTIKHQSFDWCSISFLFDFVLLDTPGIGGVQSFYKPSGSSG